MPETRKYTVVDLFAGVGGLSYGFSRNEHYEIILANEMQKDIAKAYTINHPSVNMLQGDIKSLSEDILRQAIGNRTVDVDGVDRRLLNLNTIVSEYDSDDYDGVLDALYHVQAKNDYWENDGESLTELIHKYRWYILKDALMQRGRDAVTDFIGTDISSSEFSRVLDETEMVMPDETFEKFWEKYI